MLAVSPRPPCAGRPTLWSELLLSGPPQENDSVLPRIVEVCHVLRWGLFLKCVCCAFEGLPVVDVLASLTFVLSRG